MEQWPSVTIVVLNYNGLEHLKEGLPSLASADYPSEKLELMLVDNASEDGSVEFVEKYYPSVRVVRSAENIGFAPGNNLGARHAKGEYLIFLNNDIFIEPDFISSIVDVVRYDKDITCAGAKILNWDGTKFDFVGSAAHFSGYAYQLGFNEKFTQDKYNEVYPILFACGGAMIINRGVFLDIGGFDDNYFAFYEDLDLGWRLWLLGYKVVFAPDAIAYHRHHGTTSRFSDYRKRVLFRRNALYTVIKNYEEEHFTRVLSSVLLGTTSGLVDNLDLDLDDFRIRSSSKVRGSIRLDRNDVSTLIAIHEVAENLPKLMRKRASIQAKRKRTDKEIAQLFRSPFCFWPDVSNETQYKILDAFGIQKIFEDIPRRVLVISSDILPYPGLPTVGSGLRAWGLGQGLKSYGHDVVFSMPRAALTGRRDLVPDEVQVLAWENHTLGTVVRQANPDIVIVCNWPIMALMPIEHLDLPIILDQHGPHYLERKYQGYERLKESAEHKLIALRKADFFSCAGTKQAEYFQAWLEDAGWTAEERGEQTAVVPVSLSPDFPERDPAEELTFVYGGVFLPWQDPTVGLFSLIEVMEQRSSGQLYFFGGKHPVYTVNTGIFDELLEQLQKSEYVFTPGMVSHDELIDVYRKAHVAIDLMKQNPERELAFTTRTVEYLWCGLPVIYNDYSELSAYIQDYDAGWIVDPEDRGAIVAIIEDIFEYPEQVVEKGRNAQHLVREKLNWDLTVAPLDEFIRHPRMREHQHVRKSIGKRAIRNLRYYWHEARFHYQRAGFGGLLEESLSFMKRQLGL